MFFEKIEGDPFPIDSENGLFQCAIKDAIMREVGGGISPKPDITILDEAENILFY